jgi:hypothetical protein
VIVRISGEGQYELDDSEGQRLDEMDREVTDALHAGDEARFHELLHRSLDYVRRNGDSVPDDRIVTSDIILPPEDVTLDEARRFFHDTDHYSQPVSA